MGFLPPFAKTSFTYFEQKVWMQRVYIRFNSHTKDRFCIGFIYHLKYGASSSVMISEERVKLLMKFSNCKSIKEFWEERINALKEFDSISYSDMQYLYDYYNDDHFHFGKPEEKSGWDYDNFWRFFKDFFDVPLFDKIINL